jgi:hypothetical protein
MEVYKEDFRDIKIRLLNGDISLPFINDVINKHSTVLDFILCNFSDDILTGSLALSLYGLIKHRPVKDIDIIIKDKDRYKNYSNDGYGDINIKNRLGSKEFQWKPSKLFGIIKKSYIFDVDFFIELEGTEYDILEYKGKNIKIHNPIQIISQKIDISINNYKHREDLYHIFNHFK